MKKYYLSHIDFSEIINVTSDEEQLQSARNRMAELGLLTEKGNPSTSAIVSMTQTSSKSFFVKLNKRLSRRFGGCELILNTIKKLCIRKDYYGIFMYIAFLYGFLEWQLPERVTLLPAVPEALKIYCLEFILDFEKWLADNTEDSAKQGNVEEPADG